MVVSFSFVHDLNFVIVSLYTMHTALMIKTRMTSKATEVAVGYIWERIQRWPV